MKTYRDLDDILRRMIDLVKERRAAVEHQHYLKDGRYRPGERLRLPNRKGHPEVVGIVATPVRYDDDLNPTHVLCWVPQSDQCRWLNLKTGQFEMNDLDGVPLQCR